MNAALSKGKYCLICVAHPDDESIFFGGLILRQLAQGVPCTVVCSTSDGDEDRHRQFTEACKALGVPSHHWLAFRDRYEDRLPLQNLVEAYQKLPPPARIYTHGIIGEYGHPHHQDVSYAVHQAFPGHPHLYSVAYNCYPEEQIKLSEEEFEKKLQILTRIYSSETQRFLNVIPCTFTEGFVRLQAPEVEAIYDYLARDKALAKDHLQAYQHLTGYLPHLKDLPRPF